MIFLNYRIRINYMTYNIMIYIYEFIEFQNCLISKKNFLIS